MTHHMVIDEIDLFDGYFQREPTVMEAFFETLGMSKSWVKAYDQEQAQRTYLKLKRRRERENCQHGRLPFPIHYSEEARRCLT